MVRQRRIEFPGAVYRVMARGDRKEPIVRDDGDHEAFLRTLGEMCGRTGIEVHAYVFLDNHYHSVLATLEDNLVDGMRWFQNTYTRRFNVCHGLCGHLDGGRFMAILIDRTGGFEKKGDGYHGELMRDHSEARAQRILEADCEVLGIG